VHLRRWGLLAPFSAWAVPWRRRRLCRVAAASGIFFCPPFAAPCRPPWPIGRSHFSGPMAHLLACAWHPSFPCPSLPSTGRHPLGRRPTVGRLQPTFFTSRPSFGSQAGGSLSRAPPRWRPVGHGIDRCHTRDPQHSRAGSTSAGRRLRGAGGADHGRASGVLGGGPFIATTGAATAALTLSLWPLVS